MSSLAEVYAGLRIPIIRCLELTCPEWSEPVLICNGFKDRFLKTEDGRTLYFKAANIDIQLAKKNNKGNQTLAFAVDNTTGEVQRKSDLALEKRARVTAIYRTYLAGNTEAPSEAPYYLTILGGTLQSNVATLQSGYFDMIGNGWPRDQYTLTFAPALNYLT